MPARAPLLYTGLLGLAVLLFYGFVAGVWLTGHDELYRGLIRFWGIVPVDAKYPGHWYARNPMPFFDLEGVLSWRDCRIAGVDISRFNPCDPYHRLSNYSPILPALPLEWIGVRHALAAGAVLDAAFLAMLVIVLRPAAPGECCVALLAALSHSVFYAVERANIDIAIFLLVMGAASLSQKRVATRAVFYGAVMAGALAKFYPIALFALFAREKPRWFIALTAFALGFCALAAAAFWTPLLRALALMPSFTRYTDLFGAVGIRWAVKEITRSYGLAGEVFLALFMLGSAFAAVLFARRIERGLPPIDWLIPRNTMFLCGSLVVLACFFFQSSIDYRLVFLVPALPALLALRREADPGLARFLGWAVAASLTCLWAQAFHAGLDAEVIRRFGHEPNRPPGDLPIAFFFILHQAIWWFEASLLSAFVLLFLRQAPGLERIFRARRALPGLRAITAP